MLDKRKRISPKFQINDTVGTADLKTTFSNGDTTNSSYHFHKITETFNDTILGDHIDKLPKRYNETLLKETEFTLKEKKDVMKTLRSN